MAKKRKHEAEKNSTGLLKTLIVFIIVTVICLVTGIVYIAITGNEKTLHAPSAPTPYISESQSSDQFVPEFTRVSASSTRKISTTAYPAENAVDENRSTAWTPAEDDNEPWIKLSSHKEQTIRGIKIENGYSKSEKLYYENRRAGEVIVTCDNDTFKFTLKDQGPGILQSLGFNKEIKTKTIKISIKSYYEGTTYKDICITEIAPY